MSYSTLPTSCDYLVVGAGATGMAFCDSLIKGLASAQNAPVHIVLMDHHASAGGQWLDSYNFVQLHQPSAMYGVESTPLEAGGDKDHRATRNQLLDYYHGLVKKWGSTSGMQFSFVGNAAFDFRLLGMAPHFPVFVNGSSRKITVRKKLVDARYLQPDIPVSTPPTFEFDSSKTRCIPVNEINSTAPGAKTTKNYVVIGAGKTAMDTISYLLSEMNIPSGNILWVAPHDAWITARENIGNCMEFIHDVALQSDQKSDSIDAVQSTYQRWEERGKIYRLFDDPTTLPTKFNDATLSKEELAEIRTITQVIRGKGRVASIDHTNNGALVMQDGSKVELPFEGEVNKNTTTYVHCSAGAFNYSKQIGATQKPVFSGSIITLQDVYGTPGFCFVGSILGKLESLGEAMPDDAKNALCRVPAPSTAGASSGDVVALSKDHGFVLRLQNLRQWLATPELREWLVGHRLFNLGGSSAEDMDKLVEETWVVLKEANMVE